MTEILKEILQEVQSHNSSIDWYSLASTLSCILLGALALWQNYRYKKMSDKMIDLSNMPEIYHLMESERNDIEVEDDDDWSEKYKLVCKCTWQDIDELMLYTLYLSNLNLPVVDLDVIQLKSKNAYAKISTEKRLSVYREQTKFVIDICLPEASGEYSLVLQYQNIYGTKYFKTITITMINCGESFEVNLIQCARAERTK